MEVTPTETEQLFHRAMRAYMRQMSTELASCCVPPGQAMALLHFQDMSGCNQLELAKRLQIRPPTIAKMLQRMEEKGLIMRRRKKGDSRQNLIYLTDFGRQTTEAVTAGSERMSKTMFAGFSEEELSVFSRLLERVLGNLNADETPTDDPRAPREPGRGSRGSPGSF